MTEPLAEYVARLGWAKRFVELTFLPDVPTVSFGLMPVFPGCSARLAERDIVWSLWSLMDSVRRPGGHWILNGECGHPDDAGIGQPVCVAHPDERTVIWELDVSDLGVALDEPLAARRGFVRLVFDRAEYEAAVRAMLREVRATADTRVPFGELAGLHHSNLLASEYPASSDAVADVFVPAEHGECDAEELLALDIEAPWPREALFAPGTLVEIGLFGSDLHRVNGGPSQAWLGRYFTRWAALGAFRAWSGFTRRGLLRTGGGRAVGDPNELVFAPGSDPEECHRSGAAFAQALQRGFDEGATAPGVRVVYVRCDAPEASRRAAG